MSDRPAPLQPGNQRIKRLRRLVSTTKARSTERAFVVEGPTLVAEVLRSDRVTGPVEAVFVDAAAVDLEVEAMARAAGVAVHAVAPGVLASVLDPVSPRAVAAVVGWRSVTVADLGSEGPVVVLVEPSDPGNLGTVVRTAEAAGAAGVVVAGRAVDPTSPKVVRSSAGALLRLPVLVEGDVEAALKAVAGTGRPLVATVVDAGNAASYDAVDLSRAALVLGNEAHGLAGDVVARCDGAVTIPLAGPTESLNLAAAAAVLCFESLRQRRLTGRSGPVRNGSEGPGPIG